MDLHQFWRIIDESRPSKDAHPEDCEPRLIELLKMLDADEIVEWDHIFERLAKDAYTIDLMAACWVINGGAGDDGFYYFRCWLIGMGQQVYNSSIENPDSLADFVTGIDDSEAEIYAAAHRAWMAVTGKSDADPYPARSESAELQGEIWDFDDHAELRRRLPRLAAMYSN